MRFVQTQNALLWQHWTEGAPLEWAKAYAPFEALFSEHTWEAMQNMPAPALPEQACALKNLQALVLGELLALHLRPHNHAIAHLENNLTVMHQAKDFPWHELGRLLAHEKEAAHRHNLWLYSLKKAQALDAAIQEREVHTAQRLEQLGVETAQAVQLFRGAPLEALAGHIKQRLEKTQAQWCARVREAQPNAPYASRADLPFFFPPQLDGSHHLPADAHAALVDAVFERLGLWPNPRLVRHIGAVQALPLTLNGGFEASRLAFSPGHGPYALQQWLGEMGRALAWAHVSPNQWACRHLGPPVLANASAQVFAQLAQNKTWLAEQAVPAATAEAWENTFQVQAELAFRKKAANFLAQLAAHAPEGEAASQTYVSIQAQVLCTTPLEAEAARARIDSEAFFSMADALRAQLLAERIWEYLVERFGGSWWGEEEAGRWLKALWEEGNAVPAEALFLRLSAQLSP